MAAPPVLEDAGTALSVAAPSGPGRFLVEGAVAAAAGTEREGIDAVRIGPRLVAGRIRLQAGTGVNVVTSPGLLRRELVGRNGTALETVLAPSALAAVGIQWATPAGAPLPGARTLSIHLLPGATEVRYNLGEAGVRALDTAHDTQVVEARVHPSPTEWRATETPDGGVLLEASIPEAEAVTLVVAREVPTRLEPLVSAAWSLSAHAMRAVRECDPARIRTLSLATGAPGLDHAWGWAGARIGASLRWAAPEGAAPEDVFWTAVGSLAVGDGTATAAALSLLEESPAAVADLGLAAPAPVPALATLLAARTALSLGDVAPARRYVGRLAPDTLEEIRRHADPEAWAFWGLALEALADALRHAADPETLQELRRAAAAPPGAGRRSVRLPSLGDPGPPAGLAAGLLRRLLAGPAGQAREARGADTGGAAERLPRSGRSVPPAGGQLAAWSDLVGGRVEEGYGAWRAALSDGLQGTAALANGCRGAWDPVEDPRRVGAPRAGILAATLAHGVLGLVPDAPSGRLGLAPTLPAHARAWTVRNIQVGEARTTLEYRREEASHRFTLTPTEGRVPPMVIFEPAVVGRRVVAVRVDGAEAELESVTEGGRVRVRAQLPVDGVRTLEIDCG